MSSEPARKPGAWLRALPGGRSAPAPETLVDGRHGAPITPPPAVPSDDELIEAVVRGDDRMAGLLHDRVIAVVDRTLTRIFGRRETDHDDLVQATFEHIVITLCRQRFARACSLPTWAATVATHVGLNALRSRRRERALVDRRHDPDALEAARNPANAERDVMARIELDRVREHLSAMDPVKAETLFLHDALGHDLAEVAVLTGVSVAAAQSRLVRGRKDLMLRLEKDNTGTSRDVGGRP